MHLQERGKMTMTILIVDDNLSKCRKIENALIDAGNEFITVHGINVAKKILKENKNIDGIILDMQLPLYEQEKSTMKKDGGDFLLKWLDNYNYQIPVLGNSTQEFNTIYSYFLGQMPGFYDANIFGKFLSSIKDHK